MPSTLLDPWLDPPLPNLSEVNPEAVINKILRDSDISSLVLPPTFAALIFDDKTSPTAKFDFDGNTVNLPRLKSDASASVSATSDIEGLVSGSLCIASKNFALSSLNLEPSESFPFAKSSATFSKLFIAALISLLTSLPNNWLYFLLSILTICNGIFFLSFSSAGSKAFPSSSSISKTSIPSLASAISWNFLTFLLCWITVFL